MAHREQDQGVEPQGDEIILTSGGLMHRILGSARRVLDGTGRPAAPEDDSAGD